MPDTPAEIEGANASNREPNEAQSPPDQLPRQFGRYELRSLLGRGGMGSVYLAYDPQLDRQVALKVPTLRERDSPVWRRRFLAEARAAANLQHPNICPIFDVGETDAQPYLTMAYIEGETLAARLRRIGPLPIPVALELIWAVSQAMAEAHTHGIVHRDLKPANVMIDRRGQPVVMDFGLARRESAAEDSRLTQSGVIIGSPSYMPPEQVCGDPDAVGPPADVYSLGVVLYELVTGRVPFQGRTLGERLAQIERDQPPLPTALNPKIDSGLEAIILTALDKNPANRFATPGYSPMYSTGIRGERSAPPLGDRARRPKRPVHTLPLTGERRLDRQRGRSLDRCAGSRLQWDYSC